jgi:hypothetical protein
VILYRCFAWDEQAGPDRPDGPLWFPRDYQGEGRHDARDVYGCLYLADRPISCVVEQLARFRGQRLVPALLRRRGLTLGLADLELDESAEVVDLDEPAVLERESLRPSLVATRQREITQQQALALHTGHPQAAALRWWSTYESLWANFTVFDRAAARLSLRAVRSLSLDDPAVIDAADFFAMRVG